MSQHEGDPRVGEKPEKTTAEVAQALRQGQARHEQGVLQQENLDHALGPTDALADESPERFRGESGDHGTPDVGAVVTPGVEGQRGFGVLGDRIPGDSPDLHQIFAPEHRGRSAEERRVPEIEALLNDPVKHLVFPGHLIERLQILLDGVGIDEEMRRLHEEHLRILEEPTDGVLQKIRGGSVVGIQDQNQVARTVLQAVVDVAGLGVNILRAGDVIRAQSLAQGGQGLAAVARHVGPLGVIRIAALVGAAVVEQVNLEFFLGIVHLQGGEKRDLQQLGILVEARHHHIHRRQQVLILRQRHRLPLQRVDIHENTENVDNESVHLSQVKQDGESEAEGVVEAERGECPPIKIVHGQDRRDNEKEHPDGLDVVKPLENKKGDDGRAGHRDLRAGGDAGRAGHHARDKDERHDHLRDRTRFHTGDSPPP